MYKHVEPSEFCLLENIIVYFLNSIYNGRHLLNIGMMYNVYYILIVM